MSDYDEHIVALAAFVGDDAAKAKELVQAIRKSLPLVSQALVTYGVTKGKKETEGQQATLQQQLLEANAAKEEAEQALADHVANKPDVAAIEGKLKDQFSKKLKEKDDALSAKDTTMKRALARAAALKMGSSLVDKRLDPIWRDDYVDKFTNRFVVGDDGSLKILQLGSTDTYDADNEDSAIELLAGDIIKVAPPRHILSSADRGGGSSGSGQLGGSVRQSMKDLIAEKKASGEYVEL